MQEKVVETVSQVSAESIKQIMEWIRQGVETAKEQMPQVAAEIVKLGIWSCWYWIGISILLLIIGSIVFKSGFRASLSDHDVDDEDIGLARMFSGAAMELLGLGISLVNIGDLVSIYIAPKLYVLNYLKEFLK
jgi:hypothetical protein